MATQSSRATTSIAALLGTSIIACTPVVFPEEPGPPTDAAPPQRQADEEQEQARIEPEPVPAASAEEVDHPCRPGAPAARCASLACTELAPSVTACDHDSDCVVDTFAPCECEGAGPYYAAHREHAREVRGSEVHAKYDEECECGCPYPIPTCIEGSCGWSSAD